MSRSLLHQQPQCDQKTGVKKNVSIGEAVEETRVVVVGIQEHVSEDGGALGIASGDRFHVPARVRGQVDQLSVKEGGVEHGLHVGQELPPVVHHAALHQRPLAALTERGEQRQQGRGHQPLTIQRMLCVREGRIKRSRDVFSRVSLAY